MKFDRFNTDRGKEIAMNHLVAKGSLVICFLLTAACSGNDSKSIDPSAFEDIEVALEEMNGGYYRQGRVVPARTFSELGQGDSREVVKDMLGAPKEKGEDSKWWFYDINLPLATGSDYIVCQYRVGFNDIGQVTKTTWRRPQCKTLYEAAIAPNIQNLTLYSDVLFDFDSSVIRREALHDLESVALVAKEKLDLERIVVSGHADRLGAEPYNDQLSTSRAEAVRDALFSMGVPGQSISAQGKGASEPVVECKGDRITASLIQCLKPNRRVDITLYGKGLETLRVN